MPELKRLAAAAIAVFMYFGVDAASADDRHTGYYYPEHTTEVYKARAASLGDVARKQRLAFVTAVTLKQLARPYPPGTAMFAKGDEADKLIIIGLDDGRLNTLYRARAHLAQLTATARTSPAFQDYNVEAIFTFLDLCKMLGFKQVTISDGKDFAHQIRIE